MDALKAEIAARKRKLNQNTETESKEDQDRPTKKVDIDKSQTYTRRGDEAQSKKIESSKENETEKEEEEGVEKEGKGKQKSDESNLISSTNESKEKEEKFNISNEEAIRRLRQKGEPIKLFGESDKERRLRLRSLELIEERGEKMGQNDFMKALKGAESSIYSQEKGKGSKDSPSSNAKEGEGEERVAAENGEGREGVGMNSVLDLNLIRKDINKVFPIIYYTLKGLMNDWETTLAERPIEIRQSQAGKMIAATQVQTAGYLKPLFKQLRHRSVKPDVLARLAEIVHFIQKRQYRNANDSYLQLSIGNAPWPIGVTMVGIHERSGREKIFSSNVAHVLNDEVSRKYIQSLKRLMTFAQTKYPPSDVSMLMG